MNHSEKELKILEKIHQNEDSIRQRDLAKIAGLSLGMTNSILKRLIEKGFITVKKVTTTEISSMLFPPWEYRRYQKEASNTLKGQ